MSRILANSGIFPVRLFGRFPRYGFKQGTVASLPIANPALQRKVDVSEKNGARQQFDALKLKHNSSGFGAPSVKCSKHLQLY